jgi:hypothetical protein
MICQGKLNDPCWEHRDALHCILQLIAQMAFANRVIYKDNLGE